MSVNGKTQTTCDVDSIRALTPHQSAVMPPVTRHPFISETGPTWRQTQTHKSAFSVQWLNNILSISLAAIFSGRQTENKVCETTAVQLWRSREKRVRSPFFCSGELLLYKYMSTTNPLKAGILKERYTHDKKKLSTQQSQKLLDVFLLYVSEWVAVSLAMLSINVCTFKPWLMHLYNSPFLYIIEHDLI